MKKIFWKWLEPYYVPPRWMGFVYYQAKSNKALFVMFPFNIAVAAVWLIQDWIAREFQYRSWLEDEIRSRLK